jgi:hypothetical protein
MLKYMEIHVEVLVTLRTFVFYFFGLSTPFMYLVFQPDLHTL